MYKGELLDQLPAARAGAGNAPLYPHAVGVSAEPQTRGKPLPVLDRALLETLK